MEGSRMINCGSTFPPATTAVVSSYSSLLEPRNQMGMESGHSFYPHFAQVSRLAFHRGNQEAVFQGTCDSSLSGPNCSEELRSSFAAVPPWSQSYIWSDANGTSHPEISCASWRVSGNSTVKISGYGAGGIQDLSNRLPMESRRKHIMQGEGASDCPVGSSGVTNSYCSRKSVPDLSTGGNLGSGTLSQLRAVPDNIAPDQSSHLISGCPRVFCLNTSGHLLLSNTGLMSIICLCHSWHMSVSKFCDHSGSFGANPGTSVHFESGETIAQWRKVHFKKLGIKVVDDQIGWDCPLGLSAGLTGSRASMSSKTDSCDMETLERSSVGYMKSSQSAEKILAPKFLERSPNLVEPLRNREWRSQDSTHFLPKFLNNAFAVNFRSGSDNQVQECQASKRFAPDLRQLNAVWPSEFASVIDNGDFSIAHPTSQSLSIPGKGYNVNSTVIPKNAAITEKDTTSSNIELRLGQPYQKSQPLRNLSFSFASSKLLETNVDPSNSQYLEQLIDHVTAGREKGDSEKYFYPTTGTSDFSKGKEAGQVYLGNHASKTSGVISVPQPEKWRDINKNFCCPLTKQRNVSPKGSERSRAASYALNRSDYVTKLANYDSHTAKSRSCTIPWDATGLKRAHSVPDYELVRCEAKSKRMRNDPTNSNPMIDFSVGVKQQVEKSRFLPWVTCGSLSPGFSKADNGANSQPPPYVVQKVAADAGNMSNSPRRDPSFECSACTASSTAMSTCLPIGSGTILQPPAVSSSFSSANPLHLLSFFPVPARHEMANVSPYMLHDQMRLLAHRQILDLSKQHHGVSSVAMNKESDHIGAPDSHKVPHPVNHMHGTFQITSQTSIGVSPLSVQSTEINTSYVPKRGEALFNSTENCMDVLFPNKHLFYDRAPSRYYGNENTEKPGNNEKCCQTIACTCFRGNCSYLSHANQLGQTGRSRYGSSFGLSKHQWDFSEDHAFHSGKPYCLDQSGNLDGKSPRGVVYDSSLWRDVPRKPKGNHDDGQCADTASKSLIGSLQVSASSKEQEMSNVSFGSSCHAVNRASFEGSNVATFYTDSVSTGGINNPVVDEGSGIDKCCSSDEAPESKESVEFVRCRSPEVQSSRSLIEELKLMDSLMWKKGRSQSLTVLPAFEKMSPSKSIKRKSVRQRNEATTLHGGCAKCSGYFEAPPCTLESEDVHQTARKMPYVEPVIRPEQPACSLTKGNCRERNLGILNYRRDLEDDLTSESDLGTLEVLQERNIKRTHIDSCRKFFMPEKSTDFNSARSSSGQRDISFCKRARPVVHGKYGELCCGKAVGSSLKRTKFLSLSRILETTTKCSLPKEVEPGFTYLKKLGKKNFNGGLSSFNLVSRVKKLNGKGKAGASFLPEMNIDCLVVQAGRLYAGQDEQSAYFLSKLEKGDDDEANKSWNTHNREKRKKVRVRSIYELTGKGKDSTFESQAMWKTSECMTAIKEGQFPKSTVSGRSHEPMTCEVDGEKSTQLTTGVAGTFPDALCSVCGNLDNSEVNRLLECSQCLIKVHQACYGVSRIPRGDWYCRPCMENSNNLVCVLCGYGGGAMTRALQSQIIITSLLKVWNVNKEQGDPVSSGPSNAAQPAPMVSEMQSQNSLKTLESSAGKISNLKMSNSITEGLFNSGVKQWVHMVCGLWTPGTRCPNVYTMSAFEVSGVSYPRPYTVCSLCNRPGGSCIKCRVISCCVQFHPWCAHQKGLLQSEVEGDHDENVGFYGRCLDHAAQESSSDLVDTNMDSPGDKEFTCARTEGYKGRKQDGCFQNLYGKKRDKGSCLVPQEQVDAWIHINGQKSRMQEISTIPTITAENDSRKEYLRYKQARGWRHLVVYKSGIHALGLYTSRFISRGEMVVEYIGEIVGPCVADRREKKYESGKNVQYKSACYFFRIDKENIIDATRKGGIARFVNHSCRPNCVAKVISIRNEKKVVFFAERDVYPGEEITYDYHFNHEDEVTKIPCLCNSNNCRHLN